MEEYVRSEGPWVLTDASLVIEGADLDPKSVTETLAISPTSARAPGPSAWRSSDDVNGLWLLECDARLPGGVAEQTERILSAIEEKAPELRAFQAGGNQVYLRISGIVGDGSMFVLPVETVDRVVRIGIPIRLVTNTNER